VGQPAGCLVANTRYTAWFWCQMRPRRRDSASTRLPVVYSTAVFNSSVHKRSIIDLVYLYLYLYTCDVMDFSKLIPYCPYPVIPVVFQWASRRFLNDLPVQRYLTEVVSTRCWGRLFHALMSDDWWVMTLWLRSRRHLSTWLETVTAKTMYVIWEMEELMWVDILLSISSPRSQSLSVWSTDLEYHRLT